jgi:tRNA(fMet)-specific endonuclease VapC
MNGRLLLDTNAVIAIFADDETVSNKLAGAEHVFLPAVVLGELYYGAGKSANAEANSARVDELAVRVAVLTSDAATAKIYGTIKNDLRRKGRPIPENDIWVAAIAKQHDLRILSQDRHFQEVDVEVETW